MGELICLINCPNAFDFHPKKHLVKVNNRNAGKNCDLCSRFEKKKTDQKEPGDSVLVSLVVTLNIFRSFF